jgi:hypothetical protein
MSFDGCPLKKTATNTVFADDFLVRGIRFSKKKMFLSVIVFSGARGNGRPTEQFVSASKKHLLSLAKPELFDLVGATGNSTIGTSYQISKIRQEYYFPTNKKPRFTTTILSITSPSAIWKRSTWYDIENRALL